MREWLRYAAWLLPHGVHVWRNRWLAARAAPELVSRETLAANAELKGRHEGQRCFILGNGPSVKGIDLMKLQGQTVFSVSNGYLHQGYAAIAPRYHCVPQVTYGRMTEKDVVAWFGEMHAHLGGAELFLNETEAELVRRHGLFPGRRLRYVALRESFDELQDRGIPDLSGSIPRIESVPVMVLMVAMYMGFKEIVLLGVDHDHFKTGTYLYAFDPKVQQGKDFSVQDGGQIATPRHDDFQSLARLWRQYRVLREIAQSNGVSILNASSTSELDEFPRVRLEDVLETRP